MSIRTPLRIAYDNLLDRAAAVVSATTEAASFPATQVQDYMRALRYRSTSLVAQSITINIGSAEFWNTVVVWDHNLQVGATVSVYRSDDGVTYSLWQVGTVTVAGQLVIFGGDETCQYARLDPSDSTNPDGYFEIGRIFIGDYLEADRNYAYGHLVQPVSRSIETEATNGVTHTVVRPPFNRIVVPFKKVKPAQRASFREFITSVDIHTPLWLMMNVDTELDTETYYATLAKDGLPAFVATCFDRYDFTLAFKEVT